MFIASDSYREKIKTGDRGTWTARLDITTGGHIPTEDIVKINHVFPYMTALSFGNVVSSYINVEITNREINLLGEELKVVIMLDGEAIPLGKFTLLERPEKNEMISSFTAYDNVIKLQKRYSTNLTYPACIKEVIEEIMAMCGLSIIHMIYPEIYITEPYKSNTCADVMQDICTLLGKNLVANREGILEFKWFSNVDITIGADSHYTCKVSEDVSSLSKILCIKAVYDENGDLVGTTIVAGDDGEAIEIENNYMTQEQLSNILNANKLSYFSGSVQFIGDPTLDIGDIISVYTVSGTGHYFPIMNNSFEYNGGCRNSIDSYEIEKTNNKTVSDILNELGVIKGKVNTATGDAAKALVAADGANTTANNSLASAIAAQQIADDLEERANNGEFGSLALQIVSSKGNIFKNGEIETILSAVVYRADKNETDEYDPNSFIWTRVSNDIVADEIWNASNFGGKKSVVITSDDVKGRATFFCDLIDTTSGLSLL